MERQRAEEKELINQKEKIVFINPNRRKIVTREIKKSTEKEEYAQLMLKM